MGEVAARERCVVGVIGGAIREWWFGGVIGSGGVEGEGGGVGMGEEAVGGNA
jgi:hypothetical protein